jgi:hypothetical protein
VNDGRRECDDANDADDDVDDDVDDARAGDGCEQTRCRR